MKFIDLKRALVATALGRAIIRIRELRNLVKSVRTNPEQGGMICQDRCARILLPRLCRPRAAFVDVGAHIGSVIADVQYVSRSVEITAVEADPIKGEALKRKFADVEIHNCAAGESEGEVSFFVDPKRPPFSSLARGDRTGEDVPEIMVPIRRLDDLVLAAAEVDVIKIDVEGAELGVLRGGEALIFRCRPAILFESGPQGAQLLGYSIDGLFNWFFERGYEVLVPNRLAHDGPSLQRDGFVESHAYPRRTLNYFAIPSERRIEFRDRARVALGIVVDRSTTRKP